MFDGSPDATVVRVPPSMREMRLVVPLNRGPIGGATCVQSPAVDVVFPGIVPASAT